MSALRTSSWVSIEAFAVVLFLFAFPALGLIEVGRRVWRAYKMTVKQS